MARLSHTRASRWVVTIVVLAIVIAAAMEFRRTHPKTNVVAAKPAPSVLVVQQPVKPAAPAAVATVPQIKPLITETPDPTKPQPVAPPTPPAMWATSQAPDSTKLISNVTTPAAPATTVTPKPTPAPANVKLASATELPPTADLLARAKTLVDSDDLLSARKTLNDALVTGSLSGNDSDAVKKQLAEINQTLVFSPKTFPKDPLGGIYRVQNSDKLSSIGNSHAVPFEFLLMINQMKDARKLRAGQALKVIEGPFHVVVTKSKFTLDLYLGSPGGPDSTYITTFPVGLGTNNSTPTGTWIIKDKVTHPAYFPPEGHAGGVLDPSDPKNPLGPYWMGLEGTNGQAVGAQSYGIHGTIDPNSIGKMSSMGCIRLHNEDVEVVYKMLTAKKSIVVVKD